MGQQNTDAIQHLINEFPNSFRDEELFQIINDIDEEIMGRGFSQVVRTPPSPFVDKITTWNEDPDSPPANPNAKKRTETIFTRAGAFVTQITKNVYSEDGSSIVAVITGDITRTGNNQTNVVNVNIVRP